VKISLKAVMIFSGFVGVQIFFVGATHAQATGPSPSPSLWQVYKCDELWADDMKRNAMTPDQLKKLGSHTEDELERFRLCVQAARSRSQSQNPSSPPGPSPYHATSHVLKLASAPGFVHFAFEKDTD
jgi:hypothetical protein